MKKDKFSIQNTFVTGVLILVIMEVGEEGGFALIQSLGSVSFNPCYNGSG